MKDTEREARKIAFDGAAADYDAVRPGYPPQLIDDLFDVAQPPEHGRILEIGCGTGQATVPLAQRGHTIVAIDLSPKLAAVARRKLAQFPRVEIRVVSFEEFWSDRKFDLIVAATSFHWLDPAIRLTKAAELLVSGGRLAVVANYHPRPYTGFFERVQWVYERVVPE